MELFLFLFVICGAERLAFFNGLVPKFLLFNVVTLALLVAPGVVDPSVKRDVVVHLKQEGVNRLTVADHLVEKLLVDFLFD